MDYRQPKQSKILIIGETCIDQHTWGVCDRLSPEAPVPIFRSLSTSTKTGMASNVASNVTSLGQTVRFVTNESKIMKTRFIDAKSKQHILRVDECDFCEQINIDELHTFLTDEYDATIVSDYNKGFLPQSVLSEIISHLPRPIFVDSKKRDLSMFEDCTLKINKSERDLATLMPDCCDLVITLGSQGAEWDNKIYSAEIIHDVFDVCGAGDTFLASLAVHYCQFKSMEQAVMFANKCASLAVQKSGVYSVTLDDIT